MSITGDFINGIAVQPLIHTGAGQTPRLLVIHYSVTDTVAQAVTALNARRLGYHILIEKNGTAFQTRPFTKTAAHPGLSNWKSPGAVRMGSSVQVGSIGICLMNKGFAFGPSPHAPGKLVYNRDDPSMQNWEIYDARQIATCQAIAQDILTAYPIAEVVGHHDIAIHGKFDPGPLFNFAPLNAMLTVPPGLGFATNVKVTPGETLNVRRLPDGGSPIETTLPNGAVVHVRAIAYGKRANSLQPGPPSLSRYLTRWASVDINGSNRHAGFVNMKFLAATPLVPALAAHL